MNVGQIIACAIVAVCHSVVQKASSFQKHPDGGHKSANTRLPMPPQSYIDAEVALLLCLLGANLLPLSQKLLVPTRELGLGFRLG